MTNEQIAQRAVDNAETAAQREVTDTELRDSLVRNFVQELDGQRGAGLLSSDNPYSRRNEIEKWLAWDTAWHQLALAVADLTKNRKSK